MPAGWAAGKELCEGPQVQVNRTIVYFYFKYAYMEAAADYKEAKPTRTFGGGKKDIQREGLFEEATEGGREGTGRSGATAKPGRKRPREWEHEEEKGEERKTHWWQPPSTPQ